MKHISKNIFCVILTIILSIPAISQIKGNGNIVKQKRDITAFSKINVKNGWDLVLSQGEEYSLKIEAEENLIDIVVTEIENGVLNIYSNINILKSKRRRLHLSFRELNSIEASGSSDIFAKTPIQSNIFKLDLKGSSDVDKLSFQGKKIIGNFKGSSDVIINFISSADIEIVASGSSDITLTNIDAEKCNLKLSGSSDAILNGKVTNLEIHASGNVDIESYNLKAINGKLNLSGSSDAEMNITKSLDINLSGGSDLELKGNPKIINKKICSSCKIEMN
jgi:hypothetical protein